LDSFVTIDQGQTNSTESLNEKLDDRMQKLSALSNQDSIKYGSAYKRAQEIHLAACDLITHINKIKAKTIAVTDGLKMKEVYDVSADTVLSLQYVRIKDDYDSNTRIMFGLGNSADPHMDTSSENKEGYNYRAAHLKKRLFEFRDLVVQGIKQDSNLVKNTNRMFELNGSTNVEGEEESWERMNFYHVPLAATISILSKIQSDIASVEAHAINYLLLEINTED